MWKSCFYILTHRTQKEACRNEIFVGKLASDENNRNVKKFWKNIWAEKNGRQNTKKIRIIVLKSESFFRSFFTQVSFPFKSNDIFRISEQSCIEWYSQISQKKNKFSTLQYPWRGVREFWEIFFSSNRIVITSDDRA